MMYTTIRHPMTASTFLRKRFIRIVPLYWSATIAVAIAAVFATRLFRDTVFTWPEFVTSLLFWPFPNPAHAASIGPIVKLGWTLNYEMFFYIIFAAFILLPPLRRFAAIALTFVTIVALGYVFHPEAAALKFWSNPIVLEFVCGCALGVLEAKGYLSKLSSFVSLPLLLISGALFFYLGAGESSMLTRVAFRGVPAFGVTMSVLALDRGTGLRLPVAVTGLLLALGDASYSIYLSHLYSLRFFSNAWEKFHLPMSSPIDAATYILLCALVGGGVGWLVWRFGELRVTDWARKLLSPDRKLATA